MSEASANVEFGPAVAPRTKIWVILPFVVLSVAFAFYLRLFLKIDGRGDVFAFYFNKILPAAIIHSSLFLLLALVFNIRARGSLVFWLVSILALLSVSDWTSAQALILIVAFGFITARIGNFFARRLFPPASRGWSISLAIGIFLFSIVGSFLAWAHWFTWWALAILVFIALVPDLLHRMEAVRADIRAGWASYLSSWNLPMAFSLQALFLIGAYAFVGGMAPETNSDAVRFYWPYLKLIRHYSGFFDGPRTWSYVIPQAGLIYGSAVFSLLGKHAVRISMTLVWVAMIGIMTRRVAGQGSGTRYAVAVAIASCPVVLWITSSLMQDSFVCLSVMMLAALCLEGADPGRSRFWVAVGIGLGTCWAAKYSTLTYAVPLVAYAIYRSLKETGWIRTFRGLALAGCCAIATLAPWLAHTYHQSRNPVFPFLLNVFPSPVWPRGVGFANLDQFRLTPGWRGWLLWPIDMTYRTGRFVEGFDGKLGLTLIVLLVIAIAAIWKGSRVSRALAISGIIATGLLWSQTAYLRYWLPTLWLIGMAGTEIVERYLRSTALRTAAAAAAFIILLPQIMSSMVNFWADPQGWPWASYTRAITRESFIGAELKDIERSLPVGDKYPKIWFTGYEPVGHLQVQPMEAVIWELTLHTTDPRSKIQYLTSAGCEYWLVNEEDQDALWFQTDGIASFFWNPANLVARSGPIAAYKMPPAEKVLHDFDARVAPGTDLLLNGSFEDGAKGKPVFWYSDGEARQLTNGNALEGNGMLQLKARGGIREGIALPPGARHIEVVASARSASESEPVEVHYVCYFLAFPKDPAGVPVAEQVQPQEALPGKDETVTVQGQWREYRAILQVPDLARYLVVNFDKPTAAGEVWIDSAHAFVRFIDDGRKGSPDDRR